MSILDTKSPTDALANPSRRLFLTVSAAAGGGLLIGAGQAKPAPPVGPALGQAGLNIMAFCKDFNAATSGIKVSCLFVGFVRR